MSKKTHERVTGKGSALKRYQEVVVGSSSLSTTLYYEWCMLVGKFPGALGLFLRKLFWPRLFRSCGQGTLFGSNVLLRHPHRIDLGDRVVLSDGCILDARNSDEASVIALGADTILSNNVMISCKDGRVSIGQRVGLGAQTIIHSVAKSPVVVGDDVIIGPQCYLAGGGNYNMDRTDIPISRQGLREGEGLELGDNIWLGAKAAVLPGVTIGSGSVVAAGAVVTKSVEKGRICVGVPAVAKAISAK